MKEFKEQIPGLIQNLQRISTEYSYEKYYIGMAVTYLTYLYDILDKVEEKNND